MTKPNGPSSLVLYSWVVVLLVLAGPTSRTVHGFTTSRTIPISYRSSHFRSVDWSSSSSSSSSLTAVLPHSLPWAVAHVIGGASGAPIVIQATRPERGWYRQIDLPSWTPPDRVFAPVWTTLYTLMGIAMSFIVKCPSSITRSVALTTWTIHMILNIAWAPIFFGRQQLRLGQAINIALLITLGGIILPTFYLLNPRSAYLLLPYTLWLSFATCLNASICRRNPTQSGYNAAKFHAQLAKLQQKAQTYSGL